MIDHELNLKTLIKFLSIYSLEQAYDYFYFEGSNGEDLLRDEMISRKLLELPKLKLISGD